MQLLNIHNRGKDSVPSSQQLRIVAISSLKMLARGAETTTSDIRVSISRNYSFVY